MNDSKSDKIFLKVKTWMQSGRRDGSPDLMRKLTKSEIKTMALRI
jgi:hypothetical protein